MLCGLLTPDSGEGKCLGYDIRREADKIKRQVGYMTQRFSLYQDLSVRENLEFVARLYGLSNARGAAAEMIKRIGLNGREEQLAATLSGGYKQRLALACSLLHDPKIVFLDEPTAGIDPVARREIWDLLFRLAAEGTTLFVTTHYMDEAERCSRVAYIYLSKLIALGRPLDLKRLPELTPEDSSWFEITSDDATKLLPLVRQHSSVLDATIFGEAIHALVRQGTDAAALENYFKQLVGSEIHCRAVPPSLEDVFVTLTRVHRHSAKG